MEQRPFQKRAILFALLLFMAFILPHSAFADDADITLTHPPKLGFKVSKIVFNQATKATGNCADQLVDKLKNLFTSNNIEVITNNIEVTANNVEETANNLTFADKSFYAKQFHDYNTSFSGNIDQNKALSIGDATGATVMINVKKLTAQSTTVSTNSVQIDFRISIQAIDLTTGNIFIDKTCGVVRNNLIVKDWNEIPDIALKRTVKQIENFLFPWMLPWTENISVTFFNDKIDSKDSKSAYYALRAKNYQSAWELSQQYLEWCKDENNFTVKKRVKELPKRLSHAYHNLGIMYFKNQQYDTAIVFFQKAHELLPKDKYIANTINRCEKAKSLTAEITAREQLAQQQAEHLKQRAEQRAKQEKQLAEQRAEQEKRLAEERAKQEKQKASDPGVVIKGVRWATRNVDEPGTFAASPESEGMHYQWNRKKAWPTGNYSNARGALWERANDPCPAGWRVPTQYEMEKLLTSKHSYTTQNGVNGWIFIDGKQSIFLPAYRDKNKTSAWYWSSTSDSFNHQARFLELDAQKQYISTAQRSFDAAVRCVCAEDNN